MTFEFNKIDNINDYIDEQINILIDKPNNINKLKTVLIFSGGGLKGIAHVGCLKALKELNKLDNIKTIAGSSIGAIVGFLYNIGYSPEELYEFMMLFDLNKIKSVDPNRFFNEFGIDNGKKIDTIITKMALSKNIDKDITFKDLYKQTNITLIITATCVNDKQIYYFSHKTAPKMSVILAIRMSSALPIYFVPIMYKNKLYIDGGCIDNFPIHLFKNDLDTVIGLYLAETRDFIKNIYNIEEYLINLINCLFEGVTHNNFKGFEHVTIIIKMPGINMLNLDLSENKKNEIYSYGYNAVKQYFIK